MRAKSIIVTITALVLAIVGTVRAQPGEPIEPPPNGDEGSGSADTPPPPPDAGAQLGVPQHQDEPPPGGPSQVPHVAPKPPPPPEPPHPPVEPQVLVAPSARLVPAGVVYWRSGVDTSGGLSSDARVGLGDVAEFGVALTDLVRGSATADSTPERIDGYVDAIFKMGVGEDRIFHGAPAIALGFRKSFERAPDAYGTRFAELYLVGTKSLGAHAALHGGAVFWDASIDHDADPTYTLHERGIKDQLRGFAGIELSPRDNAQILVDFYWEPEFCFGCTGVRINLQPILSWGVRYHVADWMQLEAGVRVPDIRDANLLDAQIFGQIVLVDWHLHNVVAR
jgi:hypothetical protein